MLVEAVSQVTAKNRKFYVTVSRSVRISPMKRAVPHEEVNYLKLLITFFFFFYPTPSWS